MASSKAVGLGSSVQSVQELAKEPMLTIPQQYVRLDEQQPSNIIPSSPTTIPILDMNNLFLGPETDVELDKLHSICKEWGIFQLVNHGVSSLLVEKLKTEIQEFYNLPLEEKMRYKIQPGDAEGYGQTILLHENQKIDWADRFYMVTNPVHRRKEHLLPQLPASLRESLECYISELQKIGMILLGLMGKAVKIDKREIEEMFEHGMQSVRMTYYPPCPHPEMVMGLTPHSDGSAITILLQINGVQGLEIKRDGIWIPIHFLPDAFVVNVGDILQILSNDIYNSIEHRATVNSEKERMSIAMFFNAKFESEVGPAATLVNPQNPPLFKRIGMENYGKDFFSHKLDGKSFLERMRIVENEEDHNTV